MGQRKAGTYIEIIRAIKSLILENGLTDLLFRRQKEKQPKKEKKGKRNPEGPTAGGGKGRKTARYLLARGYPKELRVLRNYQSQQKKKRGMSLDGKKLARK